MAGQAKRDYPASTHFQSPWWEHYARVEDYFARVGTVMSRGEPVRRLLVVHPIESAWALNTVDGRQDPEIERLDGRFKELRRWLLEEHVDFDYGDEDMMARLGGVESASSTVLRIGEARYDAALVPPVTTIRSTTLALLSEFAWAGGTVIFAGELPALVDAAPAADGALEFASACHNVPYERSALAAAASEAARAVSITRQDGREHPDVLYQLRREGDERCLFLCNTNRREATGPLAVRVPGEGNVQLWDAETGQRRAAGSRQVDGAVSFETSMSASGSRLLVVTPQQEEELPPVEQVRAARTEELPAEGWSAHLSEPNVLVLDRPSYRIGDGRWEGPQEVLKVHNAVCEALGLRERGGHMVQPWARKPGRKGPSAPIELRYGFEVGEPPAGALKLAMEDPGRFEVRLNGYLIPGEAECGWWVDPAIRLLPLDGAALVRDENVLTLKGTFDQDANLETMFLLGGFSVALDGTRARLGAARPVAFGDWTEQGLPFYGGAVAFRRTVEVGSNEGERAFVEVPEFRGACARVLVDGVEAGVIGWEPHEVEITPLVAGRQRVELTVEVFSHRRNAFGPLHHAHKWPQWTGPDEFVSTGHHWQDGYSLVPCGCLAPPRLSYRRMA